VPPLRSRGVARLQGRPAGAGRRAERVVIHGGGDGDAPEVPTPEAKPPGLVGGGGPVQAPRELQPGGAAPRPAPLAGHRTHVYARHGLPATPAPPTRAEAERSALVALMALLGECAAA